VTNYSKKKSFSLLWAWRQGGEGDGRVI